MSASASASALAAGGCPGPGALETLYNVDWGTRFGLPADLASRAKGIAGTASETRAFATDIENELRTACSRIAIELGAKERPTTAAGACKTAADALKAARAKLGPPTRVTVSLRPPVCTTPLDGFSACAEKCDPAFDTKTSLGCEGHGPVGKCDGTCDGGCEPAPPGKCPGVCFGRCDAGFHGTCKGACKGNCNGKEMKEPGVCAGTCDGACDGNSRGECKSTCVGGCETKAEACPGLCLGRCSSEVSEPKCTGAFRSAKLGAECRAYCEARLDKRAACTQAHIDVSVTGAKDNLVASSYKNAIEHNAGAITKVAQALKARVALAEGNAGVVNAGIKSLTQTANADAIKAVAPCLNTFVAPATEAVVSLKANAAAAANVLAQLR